MVLTDLLLEPVRGLLHGGPHLLLQAGTLLLVLLPPSPPHKHPSAAFTKSISTCLGHHTFLSRSLKASLARISSAAGTVLVDEAAEACRDVDDAAALRISDCATTRSPA